jgi:type II secretion system protein J
MNKKLPQNTKCHSERPVLRSICEVGSEESLFLKGESFEITNSSCKKGFTLVELLVALAIIVTIVTMVYGSYFATSKSTQLCNAGLTVLQQERKVLEQMAQQVRCSYADANQVSANTAAVPRKKEAMPENIINYFRGDPDNPGSEILHLVTTHGIFVGQQEDGLFDVTYKFDGSTATLSLYQTRFVGKVKDIAERKNWRPFAENVEAVELAFFDGEQWLPKWDFEQKRKLPYAVKISITCKDENDKQYCYGTVADICCRNNQGSVGPPETLVAVEEQ